MKLESAIDAGIPVYVVYKLDTKEIVDWYSFGQKLAENAAESRNNKFGPETHDFAEWKSYVHIRDQHEKHLAQLEEIERRL